MTNPVRYEYDQDGNHVSYQNPNGHKVWYDRDGKIIKPSDLHKKDSQDQTARDLGILQPNGVK